MKEHPSLQKPQEHPSLKKPPSKPQAVEVTLKPQPQHVTIPLDFSELKEKLTRIKEQDAEIGTVLSTVLGLVLEIKNTVAKNSDLKHEALTRLNNALKQCGA